MKKEHSDTALFAGKWKTKRLYEKSGNSQQ